ncbi:hypothetical protein [Alkalicoccobacillus murimartini]|uniref:Lipoprotein n=1 Tax=Alkalicoccobacillus murimartini TaxID=171685 RepID=A0ABT9YJT6_9BACI|nr:hypothetical protein [Alkalicoccobacillus murimartini]MDQ0207477.1 hypothetical protein [Alkalicoccobacillus murimartini]
MKKLIFSLSILSIIMLTACTENPEAKLKEDISTFKTSVCAEVSMEAFIFDEAVEHVDLIAHVKMNEIVGIRKRELPKAIFEADILEVIKGETDEEKITIMQENLCGFDLFEEGEEWVLFLNETVDAPEADYWIEGSYQGVFEVGDEMVENLK